MKSYLYRNIEKCLFFSAQAASATMHVRTSASKQTNAHVLR